MSISLSIEGVVSSSSPTEETQWKDVLHKHAVVGNSVVIGIVIWSIAAQFGKFIFWVLQSTIISQETHYIDYLIHILMAISVLMVSQTSECVRLNISVLVTLLLALVFSFCVVMIGLSSYMMRYELINLLLFYLPSCLCNALFVSYSLEVVDETDKGNVDTDNLTQVEILDMCEEWRRYSKANTKKLGWLSLGSSINLLQIFKYLYSLFIAEEDVLFRFTLETLGFVIANILGLVVVAWVNDKFVFADSVTHKSSVKVFSLGIAFSSASLPALGISLLLTLFKNAIFK